MMSELVGQNIPNEIFLSIIHYVEDATNLLNVARVCHRLHTLALEVLFSRCNISLHSNRISINEHSMAALPGLEIALEAIGADVRYISCDLTISFNSSSAMLSQTRSLARFISKLSSVGCVEIQLMSPRNVTENVWKLSIQDLLSVIISKSCTNLMIKHLEWSTFLQHPATEPRLKWLRGLFSSPHLSNRAKSALKACTIQCIKPYIQPFFIQTLNSSPITELSLKLMLDASECTTFIDQIHLPNLTNLTLVNNSLKPSPLRKFLSRHPTITSFEIHGNVVEPGLLPTGILPNLQKLKSSTEYLLRFFPPMNTFPALAVVSFFAGDRTFRYTHLNSLTCFVSCNNDLTLRIGCWDTSRFEHWLQMGATEGQPPEPSLQCVKVLELDSTPRSTFSPATINHVPQWLSTFCALRRVSLGKHCLPADVDICAFVRDIRQVCPDIEIISWESAIIGWQDF